MLKAFKKEPTNEQVKFRDADKFVANGYAPARCTFGHGQPIGPWLALYHYHDQHRTEYGDEGVSILTGARPTGGFNLDSARSSWLVAVKITTHDKAIAKDVDALFESHLKWRVKVTTRYAPVRCTSGSHKTLRVFALDSTEPFSFSHSQRFYRRAKDTKAHTVEVLSACRQFVHSGLDTDDAPYGTGIDLDGAAFYWRDGVDLTQVHRNELPLLNYGAADAITTEIEDRIFESYGATWA